AALPGERMRPHVKAHKTSALARRQADVGHVGFTCATVREVEGLAAAGLGQDLLLANEVVDARRLGRLAADGSARVTLAVDSEVTVTAAAAGGVAEVLIDVNVGLPRCGCPPEEAGPLADLARSSGLSVRGVMGYEGHVVPVADRAERAAGVERSMELLLQAASAAGGDVVSAGATVTWDLNTWATELQAGSYALMDTAFAAVVPAFHPALWVESTVISVSKGWAVADCGLKALGMDHGDPTVEGGTVLFCSDEHLTYVPDDGAAVGDRVRVRPAHIDPTVAYHERMHLVRGTDPGVIATWDVDLRGW
ncbi:MAG: alanine racemase, partial [Acidimicrobiia bacterium]|nr:alanine racemase [Acidimicrobiia bacterium]